MTTLKGQILTLPKMSGSVSAPLTLGGNIGAKTINIGEDGATFIPSVSADGIISWTNDKDLPNPEPVNIKGVKGDKGDKGDRGLQGIQGIQGERGEQGQKGDKGDRGEQGIQGVQGAKGETGAQGAKGADGTPATHRWSGTTLYITSASGTSSANLKGDKGDKGDTGATGANGTNGKDGKDGADGYSPVRGTDYWTEADKAEIIEDVLEQVPTGGCIEVSGATVGQTVKISAVDDSGVPTAWEAADFPSGGVSDEKWEHICNISVSVDDALTEISQKFEVGYKKLCIIWVSSANAIATGGRVLIRNSGRVIGAIAAGVGNWAQVNAYSEIVGNHITGYVGPSNGNLIGASDNIHSFTSMTDIRIHCESTGSTFNTKIIKFYGVRA